MKHIFRFLLTFNATATMLIVFAINIGWLPISPVMVMKGFQYVVMFAMLIISTAFSLWLKKFLSKDCIENEPINIEDANNSFLPTYLGYFFVALSVSSIESLIYIYFVVFVFTFLSQTSYYNPLILLFGYRFYNITTKNRFKIFVISRKNIRTPEEAVFRRLRRINNFTFIDEEE